MLDKRPASFAAACLVEVLARWAFRGVPVSDAQSPAAPPPELAVRMSARERERYTKPVSASFTEYEPRMVALARKRPALAFVVPLYAAIARGEKPEQPLMEESFLRGPLHARMTCALPGCGRTTFEDGTRLKLCSGDCGGLARYCSETHMRENWVRHQRFCRR